MPDQKKSARALSAKEKYAVYQSMIRALRQKPGFKKLKLVLKANGRIEFPGFKLWGCDPD